MDKSQELLSDITVYTKYARYNKELQRRESWSEIVDRNKEMHIDRFPQMKDAIDEAYSYVYNKKVLPSMRSLQFAGLAVSSNESRMYNCSALPVDDYHAFSETMFLLLGGTGVGYSVERRNTDKLPEISLPQGTPYKYLIGDSIEGWADAIKALMKSYFFGSRPVHFNYSGIREKGSELVTSGGRAPGPKPLKDCLLRIRGILGKKQSGSKLTPLECHDILCHIADAVLAGGIRRAAMISLFDKDDEEMLTCKSGNWWEDNPQRGRSNNSAILERQNTTEEHFNLVWDRLKASGSGEPAIFQRSDSQGITNPCCFAAGTNILTESGYRPIEDLVDIELKFRNIKGELVEGTAFCSGTKPTVTLKLTNKSSITATEDHIFMDTDGRSVQAKDLKGLRLMPDMFINKDTNIYTMYGFIQGDGVTSRLASTAHKGIEVNIGEKDDDILGLFDLDKSEGARTYYVSGHNQELIDFGFSSNTIPSRLLPLGYWKLDKTDKAMFLKGLWSANGSIIKNHRIGFKSTCRGLVEELTHSLKEDFDIDSYVTTNKPKKVKFSNGEYLCKESYDLNISKRDSVSLFSSCIGFVHNYKQDSLKQLILDKAPKVTSIRKAKEQKVYDFSLFDDTHWGIVEGVVAHNCEIALRPFQMCNLCEINVSGVDSKEEFYNRCEAAAVIGTLQASYTNFHYLRPIWRETCEEEALLGISMTGIASFNLLTEGKDLDFLSVAADVVKSVNRDIASLININSSARTTCVKPAGTTSCVLGTSSGVHAWHSEYYIRRVRFNKDEAIVRYLKETNPQIVEDDIYSDTGVVISIPQKAPCGAITRSKESATDLLERVGGISTTWIKSGHSSGVNSHNVSCTISVKEEDWTPVRDWMWNNRQKYNGISILPYDGGTYQQAPFEEITKDKYEEMLQSLSPVDLIQVKEFSDVTELAGEIACAGNSCEF